MAKENLNTKPMKKTGMAFQRFEKLAKRLIAVPKAEADKQRRNSKRDKARRSP